MGNYLGKFKLPNLTPEERKSKANNDLTEDIENIIKMVHIQEALDPNSCKADLYINFYETGNSSVI